MSLSVLLKFYMEKFGTKPPFSQLSFFVESAKELGNDI